MSQPNLEERARRSRAWIRDVVEYGVKAAQQRGMRTDYRGAFELGVLMLDAAIEWLRASGMRNELIAEYCRVAAGGHVEDVRVPPKRRGTESA